MAGADRSRRSGCAAEDRALDVLRAAGLQLIERNFRCRLGEIDLVMRDGRTLVFVEVRMRRHARFGSAAESISGAKRRRLLAAAGVYLSRRPAAREQPLRFDVVCLDGAGATGTLHWLRDALHQ